MEQRCRICQSWKPRGEFHEPHCCYLCAKTLAEKDPRLALGLPQGWTSSTFGIPEMLTATPEEVKEGYEGSSWETRRGDQKLVVRWMARQYRYFCEAHVNPTGPPHEVQKFDYPHEVMAWLNKWFHTLGPFKAQ